MSNLYIGSVAVAKDKSIFHTPTVTYADNDDQAHAKTLRLAREMYPIDQGWHGHSVMVDDIRNLTQDVKAKKQITNTLELMPPDEEEF